MRINTAKLAAPNRYIKTRDTIREKSPLGGGWMKKERASPKSVIAKYQIIAKIRHLRNGRGPQGGRLQNEMTYTVNQGTNKTQITTQPVKCGKRFLYKNACPIAPTSNPQPAMCIVPIIQRCLTLRHAGPMLSDCRSRRRPRRCLQPNGLGLHFAYTRTQAMFSGPKS